MRRTVLAAAVVLLTTCTPPAPEPPPGTPGTPSRPSAGAQAVFLPHLFQENLGQAEESTLLLLRRPGYGLSLEEGGVTWMAARRSAQDTLGPRPLGPPVAAGDMARLRMSFVGAPGAAPAGAGPSPVRVYDSRASSGDQLLPVFDTAVYADLWPGVDLVLFGEERTLQYELRIEAGADPERIRFAFDGGRPSVTQAGELVVDGPQGHLLHTLPLAYQPGEGNEGYVDARWVVEDGVARVALGDWDATMPLVIDPTLLYSTYLGGARGDYFPRVASDGAGRAFVAAGLDFPNGDIMVACFDFSEPSPGTLRWMRYFGGDREDWEPVVAHLDDALYLAFNTRSADLPGDPSTLPREAPDPVSNPLETRVYLARLDPADGSVAVAAYLGYTGGPSLTVTDLALDGGPPLDVYVAGAVLGQGYATPGAFQTEYGGGDFDGFVARLGGGLDVLRYFTHMGGDRRDGSLGLAVRQGTAHAVGFTFSMDFPFTGGPAPAPPDPSNCLPGSNFYCSDAFLVVLNPAGTDVDLSTPVIPGPGNEEAAYVALDAAGRDLVTVYEHPSRVLTLTVDGSAQNGQVIPAAGWGGRLALSANGRVHVAGGTGTGGLATQGAVQPVVAGLTDGFLATFDGVGPPSYFTYLGGADQDYALDVAADPSGLFVVGQTGSDPFPQPNTPPPLPPYQEGNAGGYDIFLAWLADSPVLTVEKVALTSPVLVNHPVTFRVTARNGGSLPTDDLTLFDKSEMPITLAPDCTVQDDETAECPLPPLDPGQTRDWLVVVEPDQTGSWCNLAVVEGPSSFQSAQDEVCIDVDQGQPLLTVTGSGPAVVPPNHDFTHNVTVTNTGTGPAPASRFAFGITPAGLVRITALPGFSGNCTMDPGNTGFTCDPFLPLEEGASLIFPVEVRSGVTGGLAENVAEIRYGTPPQASSALWFTEVTGLEVDLALQAESGRIPKYQLFRTDLEQVGVPQLLNWAQIDLTLESLAPVPLTTWNQVRFLPNVCSIQSASATTATARCTLAAGTSWSVVTLVPWTLSQFRAVGQGPFLDPDLTNNLVSLP